MRTFLTSVLAIATFGVTPSAQAMSGCPMPPARVGRDATVEQQTAWELRMRQLRAGTVGRALAADVLAYGRITGIHYPVNGPCTPGRELGPWENYQRALYVLEIDEVLHGREIERAYVQSNWYSRFGSDCSLEVRPLATGAEPETIEADTDQPDEIWALFESEQGAYRAEMPCFRLSWVEEDILAALGRDPGEQE